MSNTIGEGTGVAGRFGGLPQEFSGLDAAVVVLPVPFDLTTTYVKGSDLGPSALIEASRNLELYDIESDSEPYRIGIHTADPIIAASSEEMLAKTYQMVAQYLQQGKFVVTLGGEHSISQAPIKAYAEKYPDMSVLQLDAHADLHPAYESNPHSHASVMARVHEIPGISSIVAVGIRSMSTEDLPLMRKSHTYFAHDIHDNDVWMDHVVDTLSEHVYITLDLDVFDPAIMPSTGTPEPGGLSWYRVLELIKRVAAEKQIVGFDIVELCPNASNKGPDFLAAKLLYKMLGYIFSSQLIKGLS